MLRRVLSFIGFSSSIAFAHAEGGTQVVIQLDDVRCVGGPYGLRLPQELPKVLNLGKIKAEQVIEVEQWDGYTATRKHIDFDGFSIGLIDFSNDKDRYLVSYAEVYKPKWNKVTMFKVGSSIASVKKILGSVSDNDQNLNAEYASVADGVRFKTSGGRITKVIYDCYTG